MAFRVELTRRARRALAEELPESAAAACWAFVMGPLAENPYRVGKPLRDDMEGRYAARRGEFRVIYEIHEDRIVIRVLTIAHRRDAYA